MGACCSKVGDQHERVKMDHVHKREFVAPKRKYKKEYEDEEDVNTQNGDEGALVWYNGSTEITSMFTKQGKKGVNQDAMTVWEDFAGEKGMFFCGVFDGHGASGHKVANHVRDVLPSKLSSEFKLSQLNLNGFNHSDIEDDADEDDASSVTTKDSNDNDFCQNNRFFSSWKANLINSFKEVDEELGRNPTIDCFCSGTTAVTVVKQGDHLVIANLGDSRAVLGTRGTKKKLVPVQLTVDLKPNLPDEAERIKSCKGRIFALREEPEVFRIWMPNENCPGLAMARAFGDFCLKNHGLISIPKVYYRTLTDRDEFVVLATDGVWDVLTNTEVIRIVASVRNRSMAAKILVDRAVRAWRRKYPISKVDDCAVICMFLKQQPPLLTKSISEVTLRNMNHAELLTTRSEGGLDSAVKGKFTAGDIYEEWNALEGVTRVNSLISLPRSTNDDQAMIKTEKDTVVNLPQSIP